MSNKAIGTRFEQDFIAILSENRFWVHRFQENKNGQPCDVVAARDGKAYLFDCKSCEGTFFRLDRMEENQICAMDLFDRTGNGKGMFAIRFREDSTVYLVPYDRLLELKKAGFGRINATVCRLQGMTLSDWLEKGGCADGDHHRQ